MHQQVRGRRVLREPAGIAQDRDPVAHLDRLVDVVRDEDDRLAQLGLEAQELVLEALAGDRVERAERLVHQHHRRVGRERAGDSDALALPARELRRVAPRHLVRQADQLEQLGDARVDAAAVPAEHARQRGDVLADRLVREQPDLLDHVADLAPQLRRLALAHALAVDEHVAAGELDHAVDAAHRRRLAGAGRADEHADLARGHVQREAVDGGIGRAGVADRRLAELDRDAHQIPAARRAAAWAASSKASSSGSSALSGMPSAVAVSQSANQAFFGSSGPCR
jgi:hypothetical protein